MDESTIQRLETSFNLLAPRGEELVDHFYQSLFTNYPGVRSLFPDDIKDQQKKLLASLAVVVQNLRTPEKLAEPLAQLGRRHQDYKAEPDHYPAVRDTLVAAMAKLAGPQWNPQLTNDWNAAIDFVSEKLLAAYAHVPSQGD